MSNQKHHTVCILTTSYKEYDRRMQRISMHLSQIGYEVSWLSRSQDSALVEHRVSTLFKSGIAFYLEYNFRLFRYLLKLKPSLIYAVDLDTLLSAKLYQLMTQCKVIFDSHEYFTEVPELSKKRLKKWIWSCLGRWAITDQTTCITVNASLSQILEEKYGQPFSVLRNIPSISEKEHKINLNQDQKIILYLGAVNVGRGIELACQAIAEQRLSDVYRLWIIGDGDILNDLQAQYGDIDRIDFMGWVKPTDLSAIVSQAWLGINMLDAVSDSYYYSLTNKYFDYINHGIPAIHMDYPEYRILQSLYPVSKLVGTYTIEAFVEGVKYYENFDEYKKSKLACSQASLDFNWEKESQRLTHLMGVMTID